MEQYKDLLIVFNKDELISAIEHVEMQQIFKYDHLTKKYPLSERVLDQLINFQPQDSNHRKRGRRNAISLHRLNSSNEDNPIQILQRTFPTGAFRINTQEDHQRELSMLSEDNEEQPIGIQMEGEEDDDDEAAHLLFNIGTHEDRINEQGEQPALEREGVNIEELLRNFGMDRQAFDRLGPTMRE